jgi:pyruvate/2-oxoglutarate dehydrogenase complex dihydrolipoamide dehydrogenase (E3) component
LGGKPGVGGAKAREQTGATSMRVTEKTIATVVKVFNESEAGFGKVVFRDNDERLLGAIIVVDEERAAEVLAAIEPLEAKWEQED